MHMPEMTFLKFLSPKCFSTTICLVSLFVHHQSQLCQRQSDRSGQDKYYNKQSYFPSSTKPFSPYLITYHYPLGRPHNFYPFIIIFFYCNVFEKFTFFFILCPLSPVCPSHHVQYFIQILFPLIHIVFVSFSPQLHFLHPSSSSPSFIFVTFVILSPSTAHSSVIIFLPHLALSSPSSVSHNRVMD